MQAVKDLNQPFAADVNGRFVGRVHDPIDPVGKENIALPRRDNPAQKSPVRFRTLDHQIHEAEKLWKRRASLTLPGECPDR